LFNIHILRPEQYGRAVWEMLLAKRRLGRRLLQAWCIFMRLSIALVGRGHKK